MLLLWANVPAMLFGPAFTLDPTVVAFVGLFVLIITGTIDWDDVLSEKSAWDTLVWFGALVMLAEQLNKLGVIAWFSAGMKAAIVASGMGWLPVAAVLVLAFVFSHYLFASTTAHISAMLFAFLTVGTQLIPAEYIVPFMLMMTAGSAAQVVGMLASGATFSIDDRGELVCVRVSQPGSTIATLGIGELRATSCSPSSLR